MLLSSKHKAIFIHNQKTAGMSMDRYLRENVADLRQVLPRHASAADGIARLGREVWDAHFSFGFVRNPWARMASWYRMIAGRPDEGRDNALWEYARRNAASFEEFLEKCTDSIEIDMQGFAYRRSFAMNQIDYFIDEDGAIAVNFIGRFENLDEDFARVCDTLGVPRGKLGVANASGLSDYADQYSPRSRQIVADRFRRDIEQFGYRFGD